MSSIHLNGFHLFHSFHYGYRNLLRKRERMNEINVFPVPDGDTGNNMVHTFRFIVKAMKRSRSLSEMIENIADLSLEGARGNSGIIIAQFLNRLADLLQGKPSIDIHHFSLALCKSSELAYQAIENPQEGTILTILRKWSTFLYKESEGVVDITGWLRKGVEIAEKALVETTSEMALLQKHGVVDAGALGVVAFLEGVNSLTEKGPLTEWENQEELPSLSSQEHHREKASSEEPLTYRYCTEILFNHCFLTAEKIREMLHPMGDSLIVTQGKNRFRVHLHCNQPDRVLAIIRDNAHVQQQKVDDMLRQEQITEKRLSSIAVVTDSIADIPKEWLDRYQIHQIPLTLIWDDEEYLDRVTITPEQFYSLQEKRDSFPGSSVPEASRIYSAFSYLLDHYEHLLVVPVARSLSGTWQQMSLAADKLNQGKKRIHLFESSMNSAAQGLLVVELAKKASEGEDLSFLLNLACDLKKRIKIFVSVNTLEFMVKGGRISPLKGFLARVLNLKPIVSLDREGKGVIFDKAFSQKGLMRKISRMVEEQNRSAGVEKYVVVHASAPKRAEEMDRMMHQVTSLESQYTAEISPVVGMHSGKGAVAVGILYQKPLD